MLLLTRHDVEAVLDIPACAAAMVDALSGLARGTFQQPPRSQFFPDGAPARMGLMPAYRREGRPLFGLKSVMVNPGNAVRGLDTHQGVVLLHDGDDGRVLAVIDATAITEIRTAAVSIVATRALARPDSAVVAILGTGAQGRAHVHAMRHVFPRAEIRLWGRDYPRAEALAERLGARACGSVADATDSADVICTATGARTPLLNSALVAPGAHINAVGASALDAREIAGDLVARASRFVDSNTQAALECGEFHLAVTDGVLDANHKVTQLGDVLLDRAAGRQTDAETTLFKSLGLAVEDLAAADLAMREALRRGIGTVMDW